MTMFRVGLLQLGFVFHRYAEVALMSVCTCMSMVMSVGIIM